MSERGSFGDFLTGVLIGGIAGYAWAMLSAPRTGEETRQMLEERSRELRDRAKDTVQTTVDKTGKLVSEGRSRVTSTLESTVNQAKDRASILQDQGTGVVNDVRATASDTLRDVADKVDPNKPSGSDMSTPQI